MIKTYEQEVINHLTLLDMDPRLRAQYLLHIQKWMHSGPEFTVNRFKAIKMCLLHFWAGDEDYLSYAPWFKRSRDGKGLAGPFKHLFKKDPSNSFKRYALAVCNTAKVFLPDSKTRDRKITESISFITEPYRGGPVSIPSNFRMGILIKSPDTKLQPNLAGFNTAKPEGFFSGFQQPWMDSLASTLHSELPYERYLDSSALKPEALADGSAQIMGLLSFLEKDGACKVRTICLPISEAQVVMMPMHQAIANALRGVREDCTFDQDEGATWAHEQLRQGKVLHSIDLKSATERFPRAYQLAIASRCGLDDKWIKAFESFASAEYEIPTKPGEEFKTLRYSVGQPMGLYASFPLLALGQHGLIRQAAYNCKRSWKDTYRVLGDDVIISDDTIAREYRSLLSYYDVPVSEAKCITSDHIAEFAGFVITRTGALKGAKPSKNQSLGSLMNYVKTLGKISSCLKGDLEVEVLATALPEHGGLGLNPKGLTKTERELFFDDIRGTEIDLELEYVTTFRKLRTAFNRAIHAKGSDHYIPLLKGYLGSYLEFVETELDNKLKERFPSFYKIDGFLDHACYLDSSFLTGTDPVRDAAAITRKWVRKKYPYFFMLYSKG